MKSFRYDISFLRAISVIFVLLYHFKFKLFQGGFIGVDVFFVISGYLMTMIILNGFSKNNFKLSDFYKRRVIRIIPPLLFLIIIFGLSVYFILPTQFFNYSKSAFSSSLFFSNIYYYLNSNYFDDSSQYNFLLHTWSLSVEWQFYMIYPLILLLFRKYYINYPNKFKLIFLLLMLNSFALMLFHNNNESIYSFYIFYPRAWEMMAGGLAFLFSSYAIKISKNIKSILVTISFIIICICVYIINEYEFGFQWPSFITTIPVFFTTLIIFLNVDFKFFKNKVVTYLGNISYSLYLWHWPIYVISLYYGLNDRLRYKIFFILVSTIGAIVSYHLIEKRDLRKYSQYTILTSLACFVFFYSINHVNPNFIFKDKKNANLAFYASNYKYSEDVAIQYNLRTKHFMHTQKFNEWNSSVLKISSDKKNIILLGDSHAGMFAKSLEDFYLNSNLNLIQITADATLPMYNSNTKFIECQKYFNYIFSKFLPENYKAIEYVIINLNYINYKRSDLEEYINYIENYFFMHSIKTIYIGQNDSYLFDFPSYHYIGNNTVAKNYNLDSVNDFMNNKMGEKYIDIYSLPIEKVNNDGIPYIYDHGHLSKYGTDYYLNLIAKKLPY